MAYIADLRGFNEDRRKVLKIQNAEDEALLLTAEEVQSMFRQCIKNELNFFGQEVSNQRKEELETIIIARLAEIEEKLTQYVKNKIGIVTERVFNVVVSSEFERMVNEAVDKKLEKIREKIKREL